MTNLENLYNKNRRQYINMMSAILRGDRATGEDVVQEAFCRAVQYYPTFNSEKGKLSTWFNRILFNSLRDVQAQARNTPLPNNHDYSAEDVFEELDLSASVELSSLVLNAVSRVENESHRRVLGLFFIGGYSAREISEIEHKVSVSNVTTIVARFRENLVEAKV